MIVRGDGEGLRLGDQDQHNEQAGEQIGTDIAKPMLAVVVKGAVRYPVAAPEWRRLK